MFGEESPEQDIAHGLTAVVRLMEFLRRAFFVMQVVLPAHEPNQWASEMTKIEVVGHYATWGLSEAVAVWRSLNATQGSLLANGCRPVA